MSTPLPQPSNPSSALRRLTASTWGIVGAVVGAVAGFLVAAVPGLFLGAIALGAVFMVLGALLAGRFVESAIDVAMGCAPSRDIEASLAPRLFNLLQGLCASAGLVAPRVSVTDDDGINALVVADPSRVKPSEMIVTRGFLEKLERIEMEGAIAVCLARLRSGLVESQTLAVALMVESPWFIPGFARRGVIDASRVGQVVFDADVKGVGITRYPPGLAAAFQKMLVGSTRVMSADARTSLLWLANPSGESDFSGNDASAAAVGSRVDGSNEERPPLSERLALLREI